MYTLTGIETEFISVKAIKHFSQHPLSPLPYLDEFLPEYDGYDTAWSSSDDENRWYDRPYENRHRIDCFKFTVLSDKSKLLLIEKLNLPYEIRAIVKDFFKTHPKKLCYFPLQESYAQMYRWEEGVDVLNGTIHKYLSPRSNRRQAAENNRTWKLPGPSPFGNPYRDFQLEIEVNLLAKLRYIRNKEYFVEDHILLCRTIIGPLQKYESWAYYNPEHGCKYDFLLY